MNYVALLLIVLLVLFSGLFSGLTLGLLGLDKSEIERKAKLGDKRAKKYIVFVKKETCYCVLCY